MGFRFELRSDGLRVVLTALDQVMNFRRRVDIPRRSVVGAYVAPRGTLEALIDNRALGCGTHNGQKRPERHRVGTMLGRGVTGEQFWAVGAGPASQDLLVIDLAGHEFVRAVLGIDAPGRVAESLGGSIRPDRGGGTPRVPDRVEGAGDRET